MARAPVTPEFPFLASRPSSALGPRSEVGRETAIEPSNGRSELNGLRSENVVASLRPTY